MRRKYRISIALVFFVNIWSSVADTINGSAEIQGSDLKLGLNDGRDKGAIVYQRALVHLSSDTLEVNYGGDFEGGVKLTGSLGFGTNPDSNFPYRFVPGTNPTVSVYGSGYNPGISNVVTSGRSGFFAYTPNDWLNGAANNAHFLSLFPFDDSSNSSDRQWKAFRLRVGSSAEDRFWVNKFGEGYFKGRLDVENTIRAKEIVVESSWADYVFEDDYKLRSLSDVESHIQTFGHLPGVPSVGYIKENGLAIAEAQVLMMQKIEELTLYMIEQDKEIRRLKSENVKLSKDLALIKQNL